MNTILRTYKLWVLRREVNFLKRTTNLPFFGMFFLIWSIFPTLLLLTLPVAPAYVWALTVLDGAAPSGSIGFAVAIGVICIVSLYSLALLVSISPKLFGGYFRAVGALFGRTDACQRRLEVAEENLSQAKALQQ